MSTVIYLDKLFQQPVCSGDSYYRLLDYAFDNASHFMLVYPYDIHSGPSKEMAEIKEALTPYAIKKRHNLQWPGTIQNQTQEHHRDIIFYQAEVGAKEVLKKAQNLTVWRSPNYPEDLAFFKRNRCWFYSVSHEQIASIIRATKEDIMFFKMLGLICSSDILEVSDEYFVCYDEMLQ